VAEANGKPEWGTTYWEQMTNPAALAEGLEGGKPHDYYGGTEAPRVDQLTPKMQTAIKNAYGVQLKSEDEIKKVVATGWSYGKPAPKGYEYDEDTGLLKKKGSVWKKIAKAGIIAGGLIATIATAGAATPALLAAIGAGTGAAAGAIDGGWKGALVGGALGAVGGGVAGSTASSAVATSASQVAKNVGTQAALGAAGSLAQGGGIKGALIGAGTGAAGGAASFGAGALAPAGSSVARQAVTQAGMQAAVGGLQGRQGLINGAIYGGLAGGLNNAATSTNKRTAAAGQLGQRSQGIYNALRS
jgi:hypothetical protein